MTRIDLFIHPEFPRERNNDYREEYLNYHKAIIQKAKEAEYPIHVARDNSSDANIRNIIPIERRIIAFDEERNALTKEFDRLAALCEGGDLFVFHGAYYLECVTTFLGQAYAMLEHDLRWSRKDLETGGNAMLTGWIHKERELAKTGRYKIGITYLYYDKTRGLVNNNDPGWIRQQEKIPHECAPF